MSWSPSTASVGRHNSNTIHLIVMYKLELTRASDTVPETRSLKIYSVTYIDSVADASSSILTWSAGLNADSSPIEVGNNRGVRTSFRTNCFSQ